MEPKRARPETDHPPKRNEDREDISHHKHFLRAYFPVLLNVPETQSAYCWSDCLSKTQVGVLKKGELEFIVLADGDQRAGRIKTL